MSEAPQLDSRHPVGAFDLSLLVRRARQQWKLVSSLAVIGVVAGLAVKWVSLPPPTAVARLTIGHPDEAPDLPSYRVLLGDPSILALAKDAVIGAVALPPSSLEIRVRLPNADPTAVANQIAQQFVRLAQNRLLLRECRLALNRVIALEDDLPKLVDRIAREETAVSWLEQAPNSNGAEVQKAVFSSRLRLRQFAASVERTRLLAAQAKETRLLLDGTALAEGLSESMRKTLMEFTHTAGLALPAEFDRPPATLVVVTPAKVDSATTKLALVDGAIVGFAVAFTLVIAFIMLSDSRR